MDVSYKEGILIVEDDNMIRESLSEVLVDEGFQVSTACHGREALTWLEHGHRPCVVLLDLMMPVMDGWQLLEIMKSNSDLQSIPVVVVSASRENREPAGAVRCLRKPINLDVLVQEVVVHCCRQENAADAAAPR